MHMSMMRGSHATEIAKDDCSSTVVSGNQHRRESSPRGGSANRARTHRVARRRRVPGSPPRARTSVVASPETSTRTADRFAHSSIRPKGFFSRPESRTRRAMMRPGGENALAVRNAKSARAHKTHSLDAKEREVTFLRREVERVTAERDALQLSGNGDKAYIRRLEHKLTSSGRRAPPSGARSYARAWRSSRKSWRARRVTRRNTRSSSTPRRGTKPAWRTRSSCARRICHQKPARTFPRGCSTPSPRGARSPSASPCSSRRSRTRWSAPCARSSRCASAWSARRRAKGCRPGRGGGGGKRRRRRRARRRRAVTPSAWWRGRTPSRRAPLRWRMRPWRTPRRSVLSSGASASAVRRSAAPWTRLRRRPRATWSACARR